MAFKLAQEEPTLPKGILIFGKRLSLQEYSVRRQVATMANKLIRKRLGAGYDVAEHEQLDLRIYKESDLFDSFGKVVYEIEKNKPYPKQIADRAFDYFSTGVDTLEISGIMQIPKKLIDKWAKLFDWDSQIAKISAMADTTRVIGKAEELARARDIIDKRHKQVSEWVFLETMNELSIKVGSKAEAELKLLKIKALEIGWKTVRSVIELERGLVGLGSGEVADLIPSNFIYEIVTPEGQVLARDNGNLDSYLPNQNPEEYRPDAGQVKGGKEILHIPSIIVDSNNPEKIERVNLKDGVVTKKEEPSRPRHLYDGNVIIDSSY